MSVLRSERILLKNVMYSIERLVTEYINTCHKSFLVLSFLRLFSGEFYLDTGQMFDKESSLYILNNDSAVFLHENIWLRLCPKLQVMGLYWLIHSVPKISQQKS